MAWVFIPSAGDPVQRDTCGTWAVNPYKRLFSCVPPQCSVPMESTYYLGDAGIRQLASLFSEGGKRNTCTCVCTYTHTYTHAHRNKKEKTRTHSLCLHSMQDIWRLFPALSPQPRFLLLGRPRTQMVKFLTFAFSKYRAPISSWSLSQSSSTLSNPVLSTASRIFLSRLAISLRCFRHPVQMPSVFL